MPPTRAHAPTSIGGSTTGRVAGIASVAVGGLDSAGGGVAGGGGGASAAGGAPGGGASAAGGSASAGVAQSIAPNTTPVANPEHRAPKVPSLIICPVS